MRFLLLGGSKSGKSGLAQCLTRHLAAGGPMYYWAAMEPADQEDRDRILRHLEDRLGWGFETIEKGRNLSEAPALPEGAAVLFDSVTALLANEMFGATLDASAPDRAARDLVTISKGCTHFVCVCDDIFRDGGRFDQWTEAYRKGLALICRRLGSEFDAVCEIQAGIPKIHKGALPHGIQF